MTSATAAAAMQSQLSLAVRHTVCDRPAVACSPGAADRATASDTAVRFWL